jgi:hypothetical protein
MIDYTCFYKSKYRPDENWAANNHWDLLISAYNESERVQTIFREAHATEKHWWIIPDYEYRRDEYPTIGKCFDPSSRNEAEFTQEYFDKAGLDLESLRMCIDITGFMRPHLMFLLKFLWVNKIRKFDVIYTDPIQYTKKHETTFAGDVISEVRQISGYEGDHVPDTSNDFLIIGAGYDHQLIAHVAENKAKTRKIQMFGLPSLQADMYQENVLRANRAAEAVGEANTCFAPANDPFVTASVLSQTVKKLNAKRAITNLYLSPLATKPQVLGFALYYLVELQDTAASIIFPISKKYNRETTTGLSKIWTYVVEFPETNGINHASIS